MAGQLTVTATARTGAEDGPEGHRGRARKDTGAGLAGQCAPIAPIGRRPSAGRPTVRLCVRQRV